jgi:hypothetical protein
MRRSTLLRVLTLALAYAHTFPASKHLVALWQHPSLDEAWKGIGAAIAVALYLLPVHVQVRGLRALWRRRVLLGVTTSALGIAHAVPLFEHLPRFVATGGWSDACRGLGSAIAVVWFATPARQQAAALSAVARLTRLQPWMTSSSQV